MKQIFTNSYKQAFGKLPTKDEQNQANNYVRILSLNLAEHFRKEGFIMASETIKGIHGFIEENIDKTVDELEKAL